MSHKILVVEDSAEYTQVLQRTLSHLSLVCVQSAEEASAALRRENFEMVLLDLSLPRRDGYSVLSEIRASDRLNTLSVICITSKAGIADKVAAFSLGAEDYIVKPFDPIELRARVDAKLARLGHRVGTVNIGNLTMDPVAHRVFVDLGGQRCEVELTQIEFQLLRNLSSQVGNVYSREQLLESVWGRNSPASDRVVDVHICSLRKKLSDADCEIKAVTGVGYRLLPRATQRKRQAA